MCQLTFIHTGHKLYNRMLMTSILREGSKTFNKDGTGVFSKTCGVLKTELPASTLTNLGAVFTSHLDTGPAIGHVRAATSTFNKKLLDKDHSHPFVGEHYVLAHNGSLEIDDKNLAKEYENKDMIDSQILHAELEKAYTGDPVKDIQTAMGFFRGKFALMVYHKDADQYYIVRGRTAPLHMAKLKFPYEETRLGLIVNTDVATIENAVREASNYLQNIGLRVEAITPEVLALESIYLFDPTKVELTRVAEIKERDRIEVATSSNFLANTNHTAGANSARRNIGTTGVEKDTEITIDFLRASYMSILELDWLSYAVSKKGLCGLNSAEYKAFLGFLQHLKPRIESKTKEKWERMTTAFTPEQLYQNYPDLQIPYFLTEKRIFNRIFDEVMKANKKRKNDLLLEAKNDNVQSTEVRAECAIVVVNDPATFGSETPGEQQSEFE